MILNFNLPTERMRLEYKAEILKATDKIKAGIIGRSILGRDIEYYKFGNGRKNILIVGAHHAMEYITSSAIYDFLFYISDKLTRGGILYDVNIEFLQQKFTYWLIPCLNPDGVELHLGGGKNSPLYEREVRMNGSDDFSMWQANSRGVDLNHNYDYRFYDYKKSEAASSIFPGCTRYSGEYPESEPETKSLANFVRIIKPEIILSLHTQGEELFYMPRTERVRKIAERIAKTMNYSINYPTGYAEYGGLCDYTGATLGIPSFTVELGRGKNPIPYSELSVICEKLRRLFARLPLYL